MLHQGQEGGFFSSFMKKRNAPMPPKRSSSFREMENQPHKKYELTGLPEQDRMAMTLPRNCQRSKLQLERTVSTSSQPEENVDRANDMLPKNQRKVLLQPGRDQKPNYCPEEPRLLP